jgi:hypothetical protein
MIIILSFSEAVSLSSVTISYTAMANFTMLLLGELGAWTDLFSEFPVVADAASQGAASFSHMLAVPVVPGVVCLDAVQLHTAFFVFQCVKQKFSDLGKCTVCHMGQFTFNLRKSSLEVVRTECSDIIVTVLILFSKVSQFECGSCILMRLFVDLLSPYSNSMVKVSDRPR